MNQVSVKSKFKTNEFVNNENRGVRFMNKIKNNQNTISKNVTMQNLLLPQKNTLTKNSNLKPRINNNSFNHPSKYTLKNNQNVPHKVPQASLIKSHNELRYKEKKNSSYNTKNPLNDDPKKYSFNKPIAQNKNEEVYNDRRNIKKSFNDNSSIKKDDNNTILSKIFNAHSTNEVVNNHTYNTTYNLHSKEIENIKNGMVNNSENFMNTYPSSAKRKYETFESINKNDEKDSKEIKTKNKRFAQKNYNLDNNLNLEANKNFNTINILNSTNENMNSYNKYLNDKLFNKNNVGNEYPDKNNYYNKNKSETLLNSSYPTLNALKKNDNFHSNSLNRNYTNYELLKNNKNMLNDPNYELNHKNYYKEKSTKFNSENKKNNAELIEHFDSHKNENHNDIYYLNDSMNKNDNRNLNCITETNSEKILNNQNNKNNNDNFNSCTFDRLSEENFNSYMKRKIEKTGDIIKKNTEEFNLMDNSSNKNVSNNSNKFSNLLKNNVETQKMKFVRSNEKVKLRNSIMETNDTDLKNISNSQPYSETNRNNNVENYQENLPCFKYNGMDIVPKKLNQNELRDTANNKIDIDTYKGNDGEYLYFQNIINNMEKCNNEESDIDMLCKNVMNLNDYSLNFNYENECINDILNLSIVVNNNIQNVQQIIYNKKKIVQDKRNVVNEEYEIICQKLKDCESIFCDTNDETGEKKLKVFYEIDEKKNILKNKYEIKKMLLKKVQYKIDKLQEYTDAIKLKTLAISKRYKKTFLLIEELFRLKIIKDKENQLEVCLIPKNTETDMWHRLQLDKNEITSDACDYLWSQIESFVDKEAFSNYF